MAYKELIKNFSTIRGYLKEFFVYGYNPRGRVGRKSERSYDDEKRRVQSWLGEHLKESRGADGKTVALSIDVRNVGRNPLYRAWKSASFTDKDITLHFILMDLLGEGDGITLSKIISAIDNEYLAPFGKHLEFDESTIRKKLSEYEKAGFVKIERRGVRSLYSLNGCGTNLLQKEIQDALDFSSEILPLGIIGSTILDKFPERKNIFSFKHHYIAQALDSEIMLTLFEAIKGKRWVRIVSLNERRNSKPLFRGSEAKILPLKVISSSQTGRQYVASHEARRKKFKAFRLDNILEVKVLDECNEFDAIKKRYEEAERHLWGVSFGDFNRLQTVEFTVKFREDEEHIYKRLLREKRCGKVERLSSNTARFSAEVWDAHEMPLTTLQRRYLKTVLQDKRVRIFDIDFDFFENELRDEEPLWSEDVFSVFDRYADGDDFESAEYIAIFRKALDAYRRKKPLLFTLKNRRGKEFKVSGIPQKIEYSEKDDKFRVMLGEHSKAPTINLGRVVSVERVEKIPNEKNLNDASLETDTIVLELTDERNALERVLLHFANLKKRTTKIADGKYRVELEFSREDESEMVIRLLQFGPVIKVLEPKYMVDEILRRLGMQLRLAGQG